MLINFDKACARRLRRRVTQAFALLLGLAAACPAVADALSPALRGFGLAHAAAVDSGPPWVLGTFTSTQTSVAPPVKFPNFDPSVGHLDRVAVNVTRASRCSRSRRAGC